MDPEVKRFRARRASVTSGREWAADKEKPRMNLQLDEPARPKNLADHAADAIVRAAVERRIQPGDRLLETDLARELGISRVPVREALRLLESQGIVVVAPRGGIHLFSIDELSLEQLLSVRLVLEEQAVAVALPAIRKDAGLLHPFEDALSAMRDALRRKSHYGMAMADMDFHKAIYAATGNPTLLDMWAMMSRKLLIIVGLAMWEMGSYDPVRSHEKLLDAIRRGNRADVLKVLRPHITEALEQKLQRKPLAA
jgi:DNA-binding GntR family transcriptional regulator